MPTNLFLIYWEIPLGNISTIMKIELEIVYTKLILNIRREENINGLSLLDTSFMPSFLLISN